MQPDFILIIQDSTLVTVKINVEIGCPSPECRHLLFSPCCMPSCKECHDRCL